MSQSASTTSHSKEHQLRTTKQNKALHVLFKLLADDLNDRGLDMRKTLKPGVDIPWTEVSVKEYLWRPIQRAMLHKKSTTELTTKEIDSVFDVLVKHLGEQFGISVVFPSIEEIYKEKINGESRRRSQSGSNKNE